jgi:tetratricopeptide (TPR) repeat protein
MGRYDEAIAMLEKARVLGGAVPNILSALGQTLALSGRVAEARDYVDELHALSKTRCIPRVCFAILFLGLGDHQSALKYLEEACERREMTLTALKVHPIYDPLRSEPHFNRLLQRIHLLP